MRTATKTWAVLAFLVALALAGCAEKKGDTGKQGEPGQPGADGAPGAPGVTENHNPAELTATILGTSVASAPVVTFTLEDEFGLSYPDLAAGSTGQVRFTIAKLVPSSGDVASHWQNYIVTTETSPGPPDGTTTAGVKYTQGYYDRTGTLTYSDGVYTYTFAADITALTEPSGTVNTIDLSYDPTLTHRVAMQVSGGGLPVTNATYDFVPAGGAVSTTRNIVKTATCNQCHDQLALHGGGRIDTNYCVTCHNPGQYDANSGNVLDFKVMVHRIHWGKYIPGVVSTDEGGGGTPYQIWGFGDNEFDYSEAVIPQVVGTDYPRMRYATPATNFLNPSTKFFPVCTKCHDESDTSLAEAANWRTKPTREACGACHDNIVFDGTAPAAWQSSHTGGTRTNSQCADCHISGTDAVATQHNRPSLVDAERAKYQFDVKGIAYNDTTGALSVTVTVKDPSTGIYYDISDPTTYPAFKRNNTGLTPNASLSVVVGWGALEHSNAENGSTTTPASAVSITLLSSTTAPPAPTGTCGTTTECSFTKSATSLGANARAAVAAVDSFVVAFYGVTVAALAIGGDTPAETVRVPVAAAVKYYDVTVPATPVELTASADIRREVVDMDNCNNCHNNLALHGDGRSGTTQLCVICHNPNNTDLGRRPFSPTDPATVTVDGLKEQAIDFKVLIHGIHRGAERDNGVVVYGFSGADDFGGIEFPGHLNDCTNCHNTDTYTLPISDVALATTTDTSLSDSSAFYVLKTLVERSFSWTALDVNTEEITIPGHGLVNGQTVTFTAATGATLPTGLSAGPYTVTRVDGDTITVGVDLTDQGLRGTASSSSPFTIKTTAAQVVSADTITFGVHGLTAGQLVQVSGSGKPTTLSTFTDYCVFNEGPNTFQLQASTCTGLALTLTAAASGSWNLAVAELISADDNGRTTATASVCSACHDSDLSKRHMLLGGAGFTGYPTGTEVVLQSDVDDGTYFETCALCHGEGRLADVKLVHGIEE